MEAMQTRLVFCGDSAVTLQFPQQISQEINRQIRWFCRELESRPVPGIVELVPTYCAVKVHYNRMVLSCEALQGYMKEILSEIELQKDCAAALPQGRLVEMPVVYGGEYGPDLEQLAQEAGRRPQHEGIFHHAQQDPPGTGAAAVEQLQGEHRQNVYQRDHDRQQDGDGPHAVLAE